jgi:hypothetical protein
MNERTNLSVHQTENQMVISPSSSKDEIIDSAIELVDTQSTRIETLEAQQRILFVAASLLLILQFI